MNNKKREKLYFLLALVGCFIPMIMGLYFYKEMPSKMPIHFNDKNIADGFASKEMALFGIPAIIALIFLFSIFMINKDPKRQEQNNHMMHILYVFIPIISILTSSLSISYTMGYRPNIFMYVIRIISLFFVIIGYFLPRTKRNFTMGIRLPWTLDSESNWEKTHKFAGFLWILFGIVTFVLSFLLEEEINIIFSVSIIAVVVIPMIYSYMLYKKENNK